MNGDEILEMVLEAVGDPAALTAELYLTPEQEAAERAEGEAAARMRRARSLQAQLDGTAGD